MNEESTDQIQVFFWVNEESTYQIQVFLWSSSCCWVSVEVEESTASHWQQRRGSPVTRFGSSASLPSDSSTTLPSVFRCLATCVDVAFWGLGSSSTSSSSLSSSSLEMALCCWTYYPQEREIYTYIKNI